jgi:hypothetical protein
MQASATMTKTIFRSRYIWISFRGCSGYLLSPGLFAAPLAERDLDRTVDQLQHDSVVLGFIAPRRSTGLVKLAGRYVEAGKELFGDHTGYAIRPDEVALVGVLNVNLGLACATQEIQKQAVALTRIFNQFTPVFETCGVDTDYLLTKSEFNLVRFNILHGFTPFGGDRSSPYSSMSFGFG